jgi:hypothetical protein
MRFASKFWCQKLEAKQRNLVFSLSWNPHTWSSGVPWKAKQQNLPWHFMEHPNMMLEGSMRGWTHFFTFGCNMKHPKHAKRNCFCTWPPTFGIQLSTSNFQPPIICLSPLMNSQTWSSKAPIHVQELQERSKQIFLPWPSSHAT